MDKSKWSNSSFVIYERDEDEVMLKMLKTLQETAFNLILL